MHHSYTDNMFDSSPHDSFTPSHLDSYDSSSDIGDLHRRIIYDIQRYCTVIHSNREIRVMLDAAYAVERTLLTEKEAIRKADNFSFPKDVTDSDLSKFESVNWDFTALAKLRISELASDRINAEAIRQHIDPQDPDIQRLLDIAAGVRVDTAPGFEPNLRSPPLRNKYLQLRQPINQSMYKNYEAGKTILLPLSTLHRIKGAHFSLYL